MISAAQELEEWLRWKRKLDRCRRCDAPVDSKSKQRILCWICRTQARSAASRKGARTIKRLKEARRR